MVEALCVVVVSSSDGSVVVSFAIDALDSVVEKSRFEFVVVGVGAAMMDY